MWPSAARATQNRRSPALALPALIVTLSLLATRAASDPGANPSPRRTLDGDTFIGRCDGGSIGWDPIASGTSVELVRADYEWSVVRTPDGREGLVPTARLSPPVDLKEPQDPSGASPVGKWGGLPPPNPPPGRAAAAAPAAPIPGPRPAAPPLPAPPAVAAAAPLRPAEPGALSRQVDTAIERAIAFLYARHRQDNWEVIPGPLPGVPGIQGAEWGELTALSTYALLTAGQSPREPRVNSAIEWLERAPVQTPSVIALRDLALADLYAKAVKDAPDRAVRRLKSVLFHDTEALLRTANCNPGNPNYSNDPAPSRPAGLYPPEGGEAAAFDLQVSQAAAAAVAAIDSALPGQGTNDYWYAVRRAWRITQLPDGGWLTDAKIKFPPSARAGATAAAVATLITVEDRIGPGDPSACHGGRRDQSIETAARWLERHATDALGDYPAMWAVQQAALATGWKYFGTVDWSRAAVEYLIRHQLPDGSWPAPVGADPDARRIPETAYALLLLNSYRPPVAINKLYYDPPAGTHTPDPAEERPRDAARFVEWAGGESGRPLSWQWVRADGPDDLADAPILSVTGSVALEFPPPALDHLRAYVEQGGLILGNANCGSKEFVESFLKLGRALFPGYEFRELPSEHLLFTGEKYLSSRWKAEPRVLGLSNGVRELMLLVPAADLSRSWAARSHERAPVQFEFGANLVDYVQDSAAWPRRGERRFVVRDPDAAPRIAAKAAKATIRVARLSAGDNPDPEPGGWRRLADLLHNQFATDLELTTVKPGDGTLVRAKEPFRVAHLTGTTRLALSAEARDEIKAFVNAGGTLVVDAAGGSKNFTESAAEELARIFPPPVGAQVAPVLDPDHPVYALKAAPIREFHYRPFAAGRMSGDPKRPHVRGIAIGDRTAVFFSPEDLIAGLVGQDTDGIVGYAPETATAVMRNLLLYAAARP